MKKNNTAQMIFFATLQSMRIKIPTPEFQFHPIRKWRIDYAWVNEKIALEVEGGIYTRGRHSRGKGMEGDMEKYNTLALMGWRIIRTTPTKLHQTETIKLINQIINQ